MSQRKRIAQAFGETDVMERSESATDAWIAPRFDELAALDLSAARVTAVDRGRYLVRSGSAEVPAELTGKLLHLAESSTDLPCVGDWVGVRYRDGGTQASIHTVLPRRSFLRRRTAGRDIGFQMIAANIDWAFIVMSCHFDFSIACCARVMALKTLLPTSAGGQASAVSQIARTTANPVALCVRPLHAQLPEAERAARAGLEGLAGDGGAPHRTPVRSRNTTL